MASIEHLQTWANIQLAETESPALDIRLMLCHCLQCDQVYLLTWPDKIVAEDSRLKFEALVEQRKLGRPIAHLLGYRDFWTLRLKVNASTLIPRPETELLVEHALRLPLPQSARVLDLGTGTGAIALALASEKPRWQVLGIDKSDDAVDLARSNASVNSISNCAFQASDWFNEISGQRFDLIVSNPPYVEDKSYYLSQGDVRFEPLSALISGEDGLDDIRKIIIQSRQHLLPGAWLMLEHGYQQGEEIQALFAKAGFSDISTERDLNNLPRITLAKF